MEKTLRLDWEQDFKPIVLDPDPEPDIDYYLAKDTGQLLPVTAEGWEPKDSRTDLINRDAISNHPERYVRITRFEGDLVFESILDWITYDMPIEEERKEYLRSQCSRESEAVFFNCILKQFGQDEYDRLWPDWLQYKDRKARELLGNLLTDAGIKHVIM